MGCVGLGYDRPRDTFGEGKSLYCFCFVNEETEIVLGRSIRLHNERELGLTGHL